MAVCRTARKVSRSAGEFCGAQPLVIEQEPGVFIAEQGPKGLLLPERAREVQGRSWQVIGHAAPNFPRAQVEEEKWREKDQGRPAAILPGCQKRGVHFRQERRRVPVVVIHLLDEAATRRLDTGIQFAAEWRTGRHAQQAASSGDDIGFRDRILLAVINDEQFTIICWPGLVLVAGQGQGQKARPVPRGENNGDGWPHDSRRRGSNPHWHVRQGTPAIHRTWCH